MVMFLILLGFIGLWAVTEIVETFIDEKERHSKKLRWLD